MPILMLSSQLTVPYRTLFQMGALDAAWRTSSLKAMLGRARPT